MSREAARLGFRSIQPVEYDTGIVVGTGYDKGIERGLTDKNVAPDIVSMAPDCGPHCPLQNLTVGPWWAYSTGALKNLIEFGLPAQFRCLLSLNQAASHRLAIASQALVRKQVSFLDSLEVHPSRPLVALTGGSSFF